jgi:hypothetical protein
MSTNKLLTISPLCPRWNSGRNEYMDDQKWPPKMTGGNDPQKSIRNDPSEWPMNKTNDQWLCLMTNDYDQWPMTMTNDQWLWSMTADQWLWVTNDCLRTQSQSKTIRRALGQRKLLEEHWAKEKLLEKPWAGGTPINCALGRRNTNFRKIEKLNVLRDDADPKFNLLKRWHQQKH